MLKVTLLTVWWFRHLASNDGAIKHGGDDRTGDTDGDDGLDNEVITVDLTKLNPKTDQIALYWIVSK